jgi:hypothetical protein
VNRDPNRGRATRSIEPTYNPSLFNNEALLFWAKEPELDGKNGSPVKMPWTSDDPQVNLRLQAVREQALFPVRVKSVAMLFEPLIHPARKQAHTPHTGVAGM